MFLKNGKYKKIKIICKRCKKEFEGEATRQFCSKKCAYLSLKGKQAWNKGKKCPNISKSKKNYKFTKEHLQHLTEANRKIWDNKTPEQKRKQIERFKKAGQTALKRIREKPLEYAKELILDSKGGNGKYMLWIDSNEPKQMPNIFKTLSGLEVKILKLPFGDYWLIGENQIACIERKEAGDFLSSIYDGRLFRQAKKLSNARRELGIIPLMIIEGNYKRVSNIIHVNKASVAGAELSILIDFNIQTIHTESKMWTLYFIVLMFNEMIGKRTTQYYKPSIKKKGVTSKEEVWWAMLQCIKNIGPQIASEIIKIFPTLSSVYNYDIKEIRKKIETIPYMKINSKNLFCEVFTGEKFIV